MQQSITVYTFQHAGALPLLVKRGYLAGHEQFILPVAEGWTFLQRPYDWMKLQVKRRLKSYTGDWPVWARIESPPHNMNVKRRYGDAQILIKATVPLSRCVLSDFDLWEMVMNQWYLSDTIKQAEAYLEDKIKIPKRKKESSWKKIFDLSKPKNVHRGNYFIGTDSQKGRHIQVCIDRIYLDEIEYIKPSHKTTKIPKKLKQLIRKKL